MGFWTGSKGGWEEPKLSKEKQDLYDQWLAASQGGFQQAGDYYRDLLSDDSSTFNAMIAPEMRRFNEQIIPGLSEQFAGMGAGGLSSSGFRNAAVSAGTDLSERLGAMRAQLRQQAAQGLSGMSEGALNYNKPVYREPSEGFLQSLAPAAGSAAGTLFGPAGTAIGAGLGTMAQNWFKPKGQPPSMGGSASASMGARR